MLSFRMQKGPCLVQNYPLCAMAVVDPKIHGAMNYQFLVAQRDRSFLEALSAIPGIEDARSRRLRNRKAPSFNIIYWDSIAIISMRQ